ncbi:acyl-CoA dehydrogenase, partial [Pseudomonas aeruginosa]|nr:acyl-CoA dehydrogenase [Pseudomonas aeruginosa]
LRLVGSEMCIRDSYGIERFYRDVRLFRIYEGTTQIQQLLIARNMIRAAQG